MLVSLWTNLWLATLYMDYQLWITATYFSRAAPCAPKYIRTHDAPSHRKWNKRMGVGRGLQKARGPRPALGPAQPAGPEPVYGRAGPRA